MFHTEMQEDCLGQNRKPFRYLMQPCKGSYHLARDRNVPKETVGLTFRDVGEGNVFVRDNSRCGIPYDES